MIKFLYSEVEIAEIKFSVITDGYAVKRLLINSELPSVPQFIKSPSKKNSILYSSIKQLEEYFSFKRKYFDLPLDPEGTAFQKKVWNELLKIPYGKVISYQQLSEKIGNIKSVRAVGRTNGLNPIPVIIPCHRVIGKNGSLVGYAAGVEIKRKLLALEGFLTEEFLQ